MTHHVLHLRGVIHEMRADMNQNVREIRRVGNAVAHTDHRAAEVLVAHRGEKSLPSRVDFAPLGHQGVERSNLSEAREHLRCVGSLD
jgi:acetate kinase